MTHVLDRPPAPAPAPPASAALPKPPLVLRLAAALSALVAGAFAAALMLSDRAPGLVSTIFGDAARRLWERVDASGRADFVSVTSLPDSDQIVHVAVWATVTALVGVAVWSWRGLAVAGVMVGFASAVVESGQGTWSQTRTVESSDLVANGVGVSLGVAAVAVLYIVWTALSLIVRWVASGRRRHA